MPGRSLAACRDSRRRVGITRGTVWIRPTLKGDLAVDYLEGDHLGAAFKFIGASGESDLHRCVGGAIGCQPAAGILLVLLWLKPPYRPCAERAAPCLRTPAAPS